MIQTVKLLAAALVILGGGYVGALLSSVFGARAEQIEQLRAALTQMGFNIGFLKMTVGRALFYAAGRKNGTVGKILNFAAREIDGGTPPEEAFRRAIGKNRDEICMTSEELEILCEFSQRLGKGDVESELNNINAACARLALARQNAESERDVRGKLWRGMGFLGGMLAVILLF